MMTRVDHIDGETFHGRKGAVENAFRYSIDYVMLDPEADVAGPRLFSRNRAQPVRFGTATMAARRSRAAARPGCARCCRARPGSTMQRMDALLLAQPRVLGHVFNPVSFWLAMTPGTCCGVVIAEVSNTFGDRHSYLCHHDDLRRSPGPTAEARKIFHVSPFQPVEGGYSFRFDIRDDRDRHLDRLRTPGTAGFYATLTGKRRPLTNGDPARRRAPPLRLAAGAGLDPLAGAQALVERRALPTRASRLVSPSCALWRS
jgi:DUF1365 family protein